MSERCKTCGKTWMNHNQRHPFVVETPATEMTPDAIREARKSFAEQLTSMIRDFERQTGKIIRGVNIERSEHKTFHHTGDGNTVSLFKGVYLAIE